MPLQGPGIPPGRLAAWGSVLLPPWDGSHESYSHQSFCILPDKEHICGFAVPPLESASLFRWPVPQRGPFLLLLPVRFLTPLPCHSTPPCSPFISLHMSSLVCTRASPRPDQKLGRAGTFDLLSCPLLCTHALHLVGAS